MIGTRMGAFVVEAPLGRGAYAQVWRARHVSGVPVALKVSASALDADLAREEALQLAGFDHPGIVQIYDHGDHPSGSWLALELAEGTLSTLTSPLPLGDLARHLLRAVGHLHAHGLVHRDLKPSNILVGCAPRHGLDAADRAGVRLTDFGIAWRTGSVSSTSGTPGWAAPEQLRGAVHPSGDIYSLAKVIDALAGPEASEQLGAWLARAMAPAIGDRFPTAAHALAAFPSLDLASTPLGANPDHPTLESSTRPIVLALGPLRSADHAPCPVTAPPWPDAPPVPAARRAPVDLLDVGLALLPWRSTSPVGRSTVLLTIWTALRDGDVTLTGHEDDLDEVETLLTPWIAQTGQVRRLHRGPNGIPVPPLEAWQLSAQAESLGFAGPSAQQLARGCTTLRQLRARILEVVRGGLVSMGTDGIRVLPGEAQPPGSLDADGLESQLTEAWWTGDAFTLATTTALFASLPSPSPRQALVLELYRARAERRRDLATSVRLEAFAETAQQRGWTDLHDGFASLAVGIAVSARDPAAAKRLLGRLDQVADPRQAAAVELQRGYAGFLVKDPSTSEHLIRASELANGWFRALALATLVDVHLQQQRVPEALAMASQALEAIDPARAEDALLVHSANVVALVAAKAEESLISAQLQQAFSYAPRVTNRGALARLTLLHAQQAIRLEDWDHADRLLSDAQMLYLRAGGSATFVVLNHGLVGLQRGDYASIAAITPSTWNAEIEEAPAYIKPLMLLHNVYIALGANDAALRAALQPLEGTVLPEITREGLELAAAARPAFADALLGLLKAPTESD